MNRGICYTFKKIGEEWAGGGTKREAPGADKVTEGEVPFRGRQTKLQKAGKQQWVCLGEGMALPDGKARACEIRSLHPILLYVLSFVGACTPLCVCGLMLGKRVEEKAWHSPIVLMYEDRKPTRNQLWLPHASFGGAPIYAPLSNWQGLLRFSDLSLEKWKPQIKSINKYNTSKKDMIGRS